MSSLNKSISEPVPFTEIIDYLYPREIILINDFLEFIDKVIEQEVSVDEKGNNNYNVDERGHISNVFESLGCLSVYLITPEGRIKEQNQKIIKEYTQKHKSIENMIKQCIKTDDIKPIIRLLSDLKTRQTDLIFIWEYFHLLIDVKYFDPLVYNKLSSKGWRMPSHMSKRLLARISKEMDTEAVKYFIDNIVDVPTDVIIDLPINNNNSADKMGCLFSSNPIVKSFNKFKDEKDEDKDEKDEDKMADALVALAMLQMESDSDSPCLLRDRPEEIERMCQLVWSIESMSLVNTLYRCLLNIEKKYKKINGGDNEGNKIGRIFVLIYETTTIYNKMSNII